MDDQSKLGAEPDYVPVHRLPVWLSSEDVKDAIRRVSERDRHRRDRGE